MPWLARIPAKVSLMSGRGNSILPRPDAGIERQWIATSTRYQGKWYCPSRVSISRSLVVSDVFGSSRTPSSHFFRLISGHQSPPDFHHRALMIRVRDPDGRRGGLVAPALAVRCLEPKENRAMTVRWKPLVILSAYSWSWR